LRRRRAARANLLTRGLQRRAFFLRKEDVPGRNTIDAAFAQAGRDSLPGLAETDESNARRIAAVHKILRSCWRYTQFAN